MYARQPDSVGAPFWASLLPGSDLSSEGCQVCGRMDRNDLPAHAHHQGSVHMRSNAPLARVSFSKSGSSKSTQALCGVEEDEGHIFEHSHAHML